jgi:uncharacterized protein YeaO (DUF488 family)
VLDLGSGAGLVTFVYAASDEERNSAMAFKGWLERGKN